MQDIYSALDQSEFGVWAIKSRTHKHTHTHTQLICLSFWQKDCPWNVITCKLTRVNILWLAGFKSKNWLLPPVFDITVEVLNNGKVLIPYGKFYIEENGTKVTNYRIAFHILCKSQIQTWRQCNGTVSKERCRFHPFVVSISKLVCVSKARDPFKFSWL